MTTREFAECTRRVYETLLDNVEDSAEGMREVLRALNKMVTATVMALVENGEDL